MQYWDMDQSKAIVNNTKIQIITFKFIDVIILSASFREATIVVLPKNKVFFFSL